MKLSLGFSPCPNDTFIFDALVNKKINAEGLDFDVHLEDVQTLNSWALQEKLDMSKISYAVLPVVLDKYRVLTAGGALGKGVGPLLITGKRHVIEGNPVFDAKKMSVAIPGEHTTANMLFSSAFPDAANKRFMVFSEIENAVLNGSVDAGVIIHENRFTYEDKGLVKVLDLGEYWEEQMKAPIPLGGMIIRKTIEPEVARKINRLIRKSVEYGFEHYPDLPDYVKQHAQEMDEEIMKKHIDLYVNHYSLSLEDDGKAAVIQMLKTIDAGKAAAYIDEEVFIS
jgi:1,4-dihydroxy-6-naphthoate synthase